MTVHVIGAGPVGLLLTALLQSLDGFSVRLYEKRRGLSGYHWICTAPAMRPADSCVQRGHVTILSRWLMNQARRIVITLTAVVAASCSRPALLAGDAIELTASPTVVRFEHPVRANGALWELCFEFDLPGDSHKTDGIYAVLLATSGQRHPLVDTNLDRRGDRLVCQVGRVDAFEPGSRVVDQNQEVTFEAVELTAPARMRLRELRGGNTS